MLIWQKTIILLYGLFSLLGFLKGFWETKKKNVYGGAGIFYLNGAFVWGDALVFGFFWFLLTLVILFLNDWLLFLLILAIFWFLRSLGEVIYWLNQQFSKINRNPPEKFWLSKIFPYESVHFAYQIYWQCFAVVMLVLTIYFAKQWLK